MLRRLIAFALAAGLFTSVARAQEVAGTWAVDFDQTVRRTADGGDQVVARGKAVLVIEVKGDSAFGTWTTQSSGLRVVKLRGTHKGNSVKLVSDVQTGSSITRAGTTTITFINTYEATVTGDAIVGTTTTQSQNAQPAATRARALKFEGKRVL